MHRIELFWNIFSPVRPSSAGRCLGDHGWGDRGGSDQVYGLSLFGRLPPVWQGSFCKRHRQVRITVCLLASALSMSPFQLFAAGLGTFWCPTTTTLCSIIGWYPFWSRCYWSRIIRCVKVLFFICLFVFFSSQSCSPLSVKSSTWVTLHSQVQPLYP